MPSASSRANSSAQPGSSTITGSPARSRVRLTMSSACVAPTVVTICSGPAGTLMLASLVARLRRRPLSPAGLAVLQRELLQGLGAGHAAHCGRHEGRLQPVGREHAHAGLRLVARPVEHAADEACSHRPAPSGRQRLRAGSGRGRARRAGDRVAHVEAALAPRFHQALRQQLVVGRDHRVRAHALLSRAFAHRGQARAGRQQAVADALGKAVGELLRERLGGGSCQHAASLFCVETATDTGSSSCLQNLYWYCNGRSV